MSNFRLIFEGFDPLPLLEQLDGHPHLWPLLGEATEWTDPKKGSVLHSHDNIVLRHPRVATAYNPNANKPSFSVLYEAQPIVRRLMAAVYCEKLGQVAISRMQPYHSLQPHVDHTVMDMGFPPQRIKLPPVYKRYQIPLRGVADFYCGGECLRMKPGEVWWFDNQKEHYVVNGDEIRISLVVDVRSMEFCQLEN